MADRSKDGLLEQGLSGSTPAAEDVSLGVGGIPQGVSAGTKACKTLADEGFSIDDVAEWVGLHYRKNFDAENEAERLSWIERFVEAHELD
jgi:hypothetical protein